MKISSHPSNMILDNLVKNYLMIKAINKFQRNDSVPLTKIYFFYLHFLIIFSTIFIFYNNLITF